MNVVCIVTSYSCFCGKYLSDELTSGSSLCRRHWNKVFLKSISRALPSIPAMTCRLFAFLGEPSLWKPVIYLQLWLLLGEQRWKSAMGPRQEQEAQVMLNLSPGSDWPLEAASRTPGFSYHLK